MKIKIKYLISKIFYYIGFIFDFIVGIPISLFSDPRTDIKDLSIESYGFNFIVGLITITITIAVALFIVGLMLSLIVICLMNPVGRLVIYCTLSLVAIGLLIGIFRQKVIRKLEK